MKTSELTGAALDWAVAKCEGIRLGLWKYLCTSNRRGMGYRYSTDWSRGGPIIEREGIELCRLKDGEWRGQLYEEGIDKIHREYGATPLIAAMRCYVASKMGDDIELPEELT